MAGSATWTFSTGGGTTLRWYDGKVLAAVLDLGDTGVPVLLSVLCLDNVTVGWAIMASLVASLTEVVSLGDDDESTRSTSPPIRSVGEVLEEKGDVFAQTLAGYIML